MLINEKITSFYGGNGIFSQIKEATQKEKDEVRSEFESGFESRLSKCFNVCKKAGMIQSKISNNIFYFDSTAEGFLVIQCDSRTDGKTVGIVDGSKDFHEFLEHFLFDNKEIEEDKEIYFMNGNNNSQKDLEEAGEVLSKLNFLTNFYSDFKNKH